MSNLSLSEPLSYINSAMQSALTNLSLQTPLPDTLLVDTNIYNNFVYGGMINAIPQYDFNNVWGYDPLESLKLLLSGSTTRLESLKELSSRVSEIHKQTEPLGEAYGKR
jgi:hypothetical protein